MSENRGSPFSQLNPWRLYGAVLVGCMIVGTLLIGFVWLPSVQERPGFGGQLKKPTGLWAAICRGLGFTGDAQATATAAPPARWASNLSWSPDTVRRAISGDAKHGEFIAINCAACHGERGAGGPQIWVPKLGGQDALNIYKQLDDFRTGRRQWGVMNAVATALTPEDSADVAAYFSTQRLPKSEDTVSTEPTAQVDAKQFAQVQKLVFTGDPMRHVAACADCHGPRARMIGAPMLSGQHPLYLEQQLASFAQSFRANDPHQQMRSIASQLSADEMHDLAAFLSHGYGARDTLR